MPGSSRTTRTIDWGNSYLVLGGRDELHQLAWKCWMVETMPIFSRKFCLRVPQHHQRLKRAFSDGFRWPPQNNFCKFGSWVGSNRDGNPSVTSQSLGEQRAIGAKWFWKSKYTVVKRLIELWVYRAALGDILPDCWNHFETRSVPIIKQRVYGSVSASVIWQRIVPAEAVLYISGWKIHAIAIVGLITASKSNSRDYR